MLSTFKKPLEYGVVGGNKSSKGARRTNGAVSGLSSALFFL